MAKEIRLDKAMFEALSSDTRRKVLLELASRPRTVTELSKRIGIQKSAVYEHLRILGDVELVHRNESDNEFVYYTLTEKGKALVNQGSSPGYKIYIMLGASLFSIAGGFAGICLFAARVLGIPIPDVPGPSVTVTPFPTALPTPAGTVNPTMPPLPTSTPVPYPSANGGTPFADLLIGVFLLAVGIALLYYSLRSLKADRLRKLTDWFALR